VEGRNSCPGENVSRKAESLGVAIVSRLFHPEYGGPGIALWRLLPGLKERGCRFLVFSRGRDDLQRQQTSDEARILRFGRPLGYSGEAPGPVDSPS